MKLGAFRTYHLWMLLIFQFEVSDIPISKVLFSEKL